MERLRIIGRAHELEGSGRELTHHHHAAASKPSDSDWWKARMEESLAERFTIDMDEVQEVRRRFPAHLHDWAERMIAVDPNVALDEGFVDLVHQFCLQPLWQQGIRQDLIDKAATRANGPVVMAMML